MEVTDIALVELALDGDGHAFGVLVARHHDRIFRLAYRILGSRADAEDLTQDICVALPRKLESYRREARFTTWLHTVTVNAARDAIRRRASRDRAATGWGEVELARKAEAAQAATEQAWLHRAMSLLPPDLIETVALVLGEEMNHRDAAEVLGVSEGTVSWRMSEVRKRLKRIAEEEDSS